MINIADPDQLVGFSKRQVIWIYIVCKGRAYLETAED